MMCRVGLLTVIALVCTAGSILAAKSEEELVRRARRRLYESYGAGPSWGRAADGHHNLVFLATFRNLWEAVYLLKWGPKDKALRPLIESAPRGCLPMRLVDGRGPVSYTHLTLPTKA